MRRVWGMAGVAVLASTAATWAGDWQHEIVHRESFEVASGGTLKVDVADADLKLVGGQSSGVEIEVEIAAHELDWARGEFERMNFRASQDRDGIEIRADSPSGDGSRRRGGFSVIIHVRMPSRFDVDARTADGDIALEQLDGEVKVVSLDGDVHVEQVRGDSLGSAPRTATSTFAA